VTLAVLFLRSEIQRGLYILENEEMEPAAHASFERSLMPMLIADDQRRYIAANTAACLFLRLPLERVLELTVDDLTPSEQRPMMEALWDQFLADGSQNGLFELQMPDGHRVQVEYSATANLRPGEHVSIFEFPTEPPAGATTTSNTAPLSDREREVLARVAAGETSQVIADRLHISPTTVETHVRNCLTKLAAKNRPHAIALAIQRNEITLTRG
jgi:DNA-binding CsgD family transcriptional regulator